MKQIPHLKRVDNGNRWKHIGFSNFLKIPQIMFEMVPMPIYGHMYQFIAPGAYVQVRGPYNNFLITLFIGYVAVSVFVRVVNPFEVIPRYIITTYKYNPRKGNFFSFIPTVCTSSFKALFRIQYKSPFLFSRFY